MPFCEICDQPTELIPFPCRDPDTGMMAEVEVVCQKCHDQWSLCDCPRSSV